MADMEKLTINMNPVDLGQIELLVEQGFYASRTEFIRMAIHDQLARHADAVEQASVRQAYVIGALHHDGTSLEKARKAKQRLGLRVVGLLSIADDVTPTLARAAIESVQVRGMFKASPAIKEALADRML